MKKLLITASLIFATIGAVWFMGTNNAQQEDNDYVVRITFSEHHSGALPFFIAEEKGLFEKAGIKYKKISIASSNQMVETLISGHADIIAESSIIPALFAETKSAGKTKIFALSDFSSTPPFDYILVKKDSPIKSLKDLEGKNIAVYPGSTATSFMKYFLNKNGVNTSTVRFTPMLPSMHIVALNSGSVDASHIYEPIASIGLLQGLTPLYDSVYSSIQKDSPLGVSLFSTDFVTKYPLKAAKIEVIFKEAMQFMRDNEEETRNILAKHINLKPEVAKRVNYFYMSPISNENKQSFYKYTKILHEIVDLDDNIDISNMFYESGK